MKKIAIYLGMILFPIGILAQVNQHDDMERQTNQGDFFSSDSSTALIPISKQSLLRDVDVIFNLRSSFNSNLLNGKHTISNFKMDEFRLEIAGKIHDKVNFRFRNRYTNQPVAGNMDHMSSAVDVAFLNFEVTPRTSLSFGKLCADWGGYEFDFNPIDILTYNDLLDNAGCYLVGAGLVHNLKDSKNSFSFQVLNSEQNTYEKQYGILAPPNINPSHFPLAVVTNWRGSFFGGKFETIYSYSFFNEAKGANINYLALGNKFKFNKFLLYYDFKYSNEGIDFTGIVSRIKSSQYNYAAEHTLYIENWIRAEYKISSKFNTALTLMNSNQFWNDNPDPNNDSKLSTSYGLIPTIQYFPFNDINVKFYVGYTARKFTYTKYAETTFGVKDYSTGLFSFGIIAPLLVL
ncbi:phosphate-selective porin O/P [Flavobacterium chryseum]|uniref:porin n=1 Tax=Flavobacterium sp. P3160 TaxID=2512113 RepID=UPI0010608577|nr:porin [Flavobacterium sp. P3160]TDO68808.1 phosphate-selective porin O/P [Flavobacterium sp. P3160]